MHIYNIVSDPGNLFPFLMNLGCRRGTELRIPLWGLIMCATSQWVV